MTGNHPTAVRRRAVGAGLALAALMLTIAAPAAADTEREKRGSCSGDARWELSLEKEFGRIEIDLEIDTPRAGRKWDVRLRHDGKLFLSTRRTTDREGEVDIHRTRRDHAGKDVIRFRAIERSSGQVCTGRLSI